MFLEIQNALNPAEIERLREIGGSAVFVDGRISNPHNQTKQNLQVDPRDNGFQESGRIVGQALRLISRSRSMTPGFKTFWIARNMTGTPACVARARREALG